MNQCVICYNTYNRTNRAPVSMPCGHTFCRQCCIRQTAAEKLFSCGVCRQVSLIGLNGTKKNLALIQILESLNLLDTDDSVEGTSKDSDAPIEITKFQAEVITDAMQTLSEFIRQKFSGNDKVVDILENAVIAVDDVFACADSDDDDWDDSDDEDDGELGDGENANNEADDNENEDQADVIGLQVMPQTFTTSHGMVLLILMAMVMNPTLLQAGAPRPNQQLSDNSNVGETSAASVFNAAVRRSLARFHNTNPPLADNNTNNNQS